VSQATFDNGQHEEALLAYIEQRYDAAVTLLRPVAQCGIANAQCLLGIMYELGDGVAIDYSEAQFWYKKAIAQGDGDAAFYLAGMYELERGITRDAAAIESLTRLAAERGNGDAQRSLGKILIDGSSNESEYREALFWYQEAANSGHAEAMNDLGLMYEHGRGAAQDYAVAMEWYGKAAASGEPAGEYNIGRLYSEGRGVERNERIALDWYERAAKQGHVMAQFAAALTYDRGSSENRNWAASIRWYEAASAQGHQEAIKRLTELFTSCGADDLAPSRGSLNSDSNHIKHWSEVLCVTRDASFEHVKRVYRNAIKQYHPDVTSGLSVKFREIAEMRSRQLNGAFEAAKQSLNSKKEWWQ
jgi:TPR repeat protein